MSLATCAPSMTRTGLRVDICNEEKSWPLFEEHCRSVAASLVVFVLQGKKGVSLQHHLNTAALLGIVGELLVLVIEEMRKRTEQF